ncbi:MAG: hypothetical protein C0410_11795, partial [Anaerolinea sp.]|nr:hypothetical protein [Anaerolinea sp.]
SLKIFVWFVVNIFSTTNFKFPLDGLSRRVRSTTHGPIPAYLLCGGVVAPPLIYFIDYFIVLLHRVLYFYIFFCVFENFRLVRG